LKRSFFPENIASSVDAVKDLPKRQGRARNQVFVGEAINLDRISVLSTYMAFLLKTSSKVRRPTAGREAFSILISSSA
jgi:hypothetical protein